MFLIFVKSIHKPLLLVQMSFHERLQKIRKLRGLSQEELAIRIGTQGPAIGRYERGIAKPTIEVAAKIAKTLEVSLDYLTGIADEQLDGETIKRIESIQGLSENDKQHIYALLDAFLRDHKTKQAYQ